MQNEERSHALETQVRTLKRIVCLGCCLLGVSMFAGCSSMFEGLADSIDVLNNWGRNEEEPPVNLPPEPYPWMYDGLEDREPQFDAEPELYPPSNLQELNQRYPKCDSCGKRNGIACRCK